MSKIQFLITLIAIQAPFSMADVTPTPAEKQKVDIVLKNGVIHNGKGDVLKNQSILISNGKIAKISDQISEEDRLSLDLQGMQIYPGFIAADTTMGLVEVDAVRATRDSNESGEFNPNVRAIIGYNTDSMQTPTVRSNGVLLAQIAPRGGLFSGTSSVVQLDAWSWEDAAYSIDEGVYLNWPSDNYKRVARIYELMEDSVSYLKAKQARADLASDARYEAMIPVLQRKSNLYIRANSESQILEAIEFSNEFDVPFVLVGGLDSHLVVGLLKERNIPVLLDPIHDVPSYEDDDIDIIFRLPAILQDAGILFGMKAPRFSAEYRNLPFLAGTATGYGLSPEHALQAISWNVARILGISNRTGSIEVGMDANLIVSSGDALYIPSSNITAAFIQGRMIDLDNKQKQLYRRFKEKLRRLTESEDLL